MPSRGAMDGAKTNGCTGATVTPVPEVGEGVTARVSGAGRSCSHRSSGMPEWKPQASRYSCSAPDGSRPCSAARRNAPKVARPRSSTRSRVSGSFPAAAAAAALRSVSAASALTASRSSGSSPVSSVRFAASSAVSAAVRVSWAASTLTRSRNSDCLSSSSCVFVILAMSFRVRLCHL